MLKVKYFWSTNLDPSSVDSEAKARVSAVGCSGSVSHKQSVIFVPTEDVDEVETRTVTLGEKLSKRTLNDFAISSCTQYQFPDDIRMETGGMGLCHSHSSIY